MNNVRQLEHASIVIPGEDPGPSKWRDAVAGSRICVSHSGMTGGLLHHEVEIRVRIGLIGEPEVPPFFFKRIKACLYHQAL